MGGFDNAEPWGTGLWPLTSTGKRNEGGEPTQSTRQHGALSRNIHLCKIKYKCRIEFSNWFSLVRKIKRFYQKQSLTPPLINEMIYFSLF
jgi:hypothetical protein